MLLNITGGFCLDPSLVKLIHVRRDQRKVPSGTQVVSTLVVKMDDDSLMPIITFDNDEDAVALAYQCADHINKALGE